MRVHLWHTELGYAWCGDRIEQQGGIDDGEEQGGSWRPVEANCRVCLDRALHHHAITAADLSVQIVKLGYSPMRGRR